MVEWLDNTFSPWLLGLFMVGGGALATWILVRIRHSHEKPGEPDTDNDLAAVFVLIVTGMYGILVAFTIFIVWTYVDRADQAASVEAGTISGLARQSVAFPQPGQHELQEALRAYSESVIHDEWPTMAHGQSSPVTAQLFDHLFVVADSLPAGSTSIDLNSELAGLSEQRTARLLLSGAALPGVFWFTLILGALLAVALSLFFFTESPRAHGLMAVAAAVLICASLWLIIEVDHPFSGFGMQPDAFERALYNISLIQSGQSANHAHNTLRFGLVLDTGGRDDEGFNRLAYEGALLARTRYVVKFDYVVASTVSTQVYAQDLERFARQGDVLVIGVGFPMAQAMLQAARAFPNTDFALIDSAPADARGNTVNLKNVANLIFREQESGYLVGYMAGLMEKGKVGAATHNTIGAMGGLSIPPVNQYIAGYIQGARAADPGIKILLGYSQSFTAQGPALTIGLGQIAQGADILFQVAGGSGLGYLQAAQEKNVYGIGVDADQSFLGPYIMTSALKRVDQAIVVSVGNTIDGSFKGGDSIFDLNNNGTGYGTAGSMVPPSIIAQVNAQEQLIAAGKLVPTAVIPSKL